MTTRQNASLLAASVAGIVAPGMVTDVVRVVVDVVVPTARRFG